MVNRTYAPSAGTDLRRDSVEPRFTVAEGIAHTTNAVILAFAIFLIVHGFLGGTWLDFTLLMDAEDLASHERLGVVALLKLLDATYPPEVYGVFVSWGILSMTWRFAVVPRLMNSGHW